MIRTRFIQNKDIDMTNTIAIARTASPRMTASLAVLLGATLLLGACGSEKQTTTTTEQTTTRQVVPAPGPTSTTTVTRTLQTPP